MKDLVFSLSKPLTSDTSQRDLDLKENSDGSLEYSSMAYERVAASAKYVMERTQYRPKIAIICGSGLGKPPTLLDLATILTHSLIFV